MYYPKSQITINLYTNGNELEIYKTKQNYIGYYYVVSNGNSFVGKTPTSENSQQLLVPIETQTIITPSPLLPKVIQQNPLLSNINYSNKVNERYIPKPSSQIPTPTDYNRGVISRFFCKKNNENLYFEIDKKTFIDLRNNSLIVAFELYTPILINWALTGNIEQVFFNNKTEVLNIEQSQNLFGLSLYFKNNFSQYYQNSTQENLYTNGGEYTTKNGKEYIGDYHIHPEKGPMVGATHINTPHDYLYPISESNTFTTGSIISPSTLEPLTYNSPTLGGGGGGY